MLHVLCRVSLTSLIERTSCLLKLLDIFRDSYLGPLSERIKMGSLSVSLPAVSFQCPSEINTSFKSVTCKVTLYFTSMHCPDFSAQLFLIPWFYV